MSEQLADEIRAFKREHPGMSQVAISRRFNVNQGRISEALKGKRA
jgi:predicted XRE-type DNA-binding protein